MNKNQNINQLFTALSLLCILGLFSVSCEPNPDDLGEQFFLDDALEGAKINYDIVAYNKTNNDTVRADAKSLNIVRLGAFKEDVFGMQKASYISQIRLSSYNPNFGGNAVLDSAVLYLSPFYDADSLVTESVTDFSFPDGNNSTIESTQNLRVYPVKKYGNEKINGSDAILNINVYEVTDFLKSPNDLVYSDKVINTSTLLGTKEFKGVVSSVKITEKDNINKVLFETRPSLRIPLDVDFFQTKIIDQQGSDNLKDVASFIRYFRGLKISVSEQDGYLFGFYPNSLSIKLYYKRDDDNGERISAEYTMPMADGNAHIGQYEYDRNGTALQNALSNTNSTDGDARLYAQAMGGPSVMLKVPSAIIAELKDKYNEDKIGIIGAKIRLYADEDSWNNHYPRPASFTLLKEDATDFLSEFNTLMAIPNFKLIKPYDLGEVASYYDLSITQTLKEAVENTTTNEDIVLELNVGSFKYDSNNVLQGYQHTTTPYAPERIVLIGSDANHNKRVQLQVTYAEKK